MCVFGMVGRGEKGKWGEMCVIYTVREAREGQGKKKGGGTAFFS